MKASSWEIEDALHEDIPIHDRLTPLEFVVENGQLLGMLFERVEGRVDEQGRRRLVPTGEAPVFLPCDEVLLAVGQQNAFPWIERDIGIEFGRGGLPVLDAVTHQSTLPRVFFGGDAAFGPKNVITAVAQGHQAAISIHLHCEGRDLRLRPHPRVNLAGQKMGFHDWIYDSQVTDDERQVVPVVDKVKSLKDRLLEVELGFDRERGYREARRCLNCDVQTVFETKLCIECDACIDICPVDCLTITHNGDEADLRGRLKAPAKNVTQALYVSAPLKHTARVMVKDEDLCVHCGLCAERCPTAAWDMQKATIRWPHAKDEAAAHAAKMPKSA
jgi:ferredoxin